MTIAFRVDASEEIGSGHVMRCLSLAAEMSRLGLQVAFICKLHRGNLISHIQGLGYQVARLPVDGGDDGVLPHSSWLGSTQETDAALTEKALIGLQIDMIIVDHYGIDQTWHRFLRGSCKKLMVIDDVVDRGLDCDILLNQNYGRGISEYNSLLKGEPSPLMGPKYALLRPEFHEFRTKSLIRRRQVTKVTRILISFGGVDRENKTLQILEALAGIDLKAITAVDVVLGAAAINADSVEAFLQKFPVQARLLRNVANMAELMYQADLCIGAPGSSSWERCCLGLPSIQLVQARNQLEVARALSSSGLALTLSDINVLEKAIEQVEKNYSQMSAAGAAITDGKGAKRVANLLRGQLHGVSDCRAIGFERLSTIQSNYVLRMRNHPDIRRWMSNCEEISNEEHNEFMEKLSADSQSRYYLIVENNDTLGVINFRNITASDSSAFFGVYANPFLIRKGTGTKLLHCAVDIALTTLEVDFLKLTVLEKNEKAKRLYKNFGFKLCKNIILSDQKKYLQMTKVILEP